MKAISVSRIMRTLISSSAYVPFFSKVTARRGASSGSQPAAAAAAARNPFHCIVRVFRRVPLPADWARGVFARCASARRQCRPRHIAVSARECVSASEPSFLPHKESECPSIGRSRRAPYFPMPSCWISCFLRIGRRKRKECVANFAQGRLFFFILTRACKNWTPWTETIIFPERFNKPTRVRRIGMSIGELYAAHAVDRLCFSCFNAHKSHTHTLAETARGARAKKQVRSAAAHLPPPPFEPIVCIWLIQRRGNLQA